MAGNLHCERSVIRTRIETSRLLQYANENRHCDFFHDTTIGVGNTLIQANRMVLSCYSRFFEKKFRTKDKFHESVDLQGLEPEPVSILIDFIYSGTININSNNVIAILSAAQYLKIDEVMEYCFEFLEFVVNAENCVYLLAVANSYEKDSLKVKIYELMSKNPDVIIRSDEFNKFSKKNVATFLLTLRQNEVAETVLYEAALAWTRHDTEKRKKDFSDLFQLLNLDQLSNDFVTNVVYEENLIKEDLFCSRLVMEKMAKLLKENKENYNRSSIISSGGCRTGSKVTEIYNLSGVTAKTFPDLPVELWSHCSLLKESSVYCIAGCVRSDGASCKVWKMNLNDNHLFWKGVAQLNQNRLDMAGTVYGDSLLVAGGYDGTDTLNSVEICSKPFKLWKFISPLNQRRSGNAAVSHEGSIIVLGGMESGNNFLSSVERLRSLEFQWEYMGSMQSTRSWFAAVSCRGFIFAMGGRAGAGYTTATKSVEKFDPELNRWVFVADMNFERWGHSACVLNNKIFVVGGRQKRNMIVKAVECYDVESDTWTIVGETKDQLTSHSIAVL